MHFKNSWANWKNWNLHHLVLRQVHLDLLNALRSDIYAIDARMPCPEGMVCLIPVEQLKTVGHEKNII